jgi:hypothetical protein
MTVWTLSPDVEFSEIEALKYQPAISPDVVFTELHTHPVLQARKFATPIHNYNYGCLEFVDFVDAGVEIVNTYGATEGGGLAFDPYKRVPWMLLNSFGFACEFRIDNPELNNFLVCQVLGEEAGSSPLWSVYIASDSKVMICRRTDIGRETIDTGMLVTAGTPSHNRIVVWYRWDGAHWVHTVYLNGEQSNHLGSDNVQYSEVPGSTYGNVIMGAGVAEMGQGWLIGAIRQFKIYDCPAWSDAICLKASSDGLFPHKSLWLDLPLMKVSDSSNKVKDRYFINNGEAAIFPYDKRLGPLTEHASLTLAFRCFIQYSALKSNAYVLAVGDEDVDQEQVYGLYWGTSNSGGANLYYREAYAGDAATEFILATAIPYNEVVYVVVVVTGYNTTVTSYYVQGRDLSTIISENGERAQDHFPPMEPEFHLYIGTDAWVGTEPMFNGGLWDVMMYWGVWNADERRTFLNGEMPNRYNKLFNMKDFRDNGANGIELFSRNGLMISDPLLTSVISDVYTIGTIPEGIAYVPWLLHKGEFNFSYESLYTDLIGSYDFHDNAANTTVVDATGRGLGTASTTTDVLYSASGKIGSCFKFRGGANNDGVDLADLEPITGKYICRGKPWSVSFWINSPDNANVETLVGTAVLGTIEGIGIVKYGGTDEIATLWVSSDGVYRMYCNDSHVIGHDVWHFVTITYNGNMNIEYNSGNVKIYIDAVSPAALTSTSVVGGAMVSDCALNPWSVGRFTEDAAGTYDSTSYMEQLRIWKRELTQAEITRLYNGGTGLVF